jgi:hypothetical protein
MVLHHLLHLQLHLVVVVAVVVALQTNMIYILTWRLERFIAI